MRGSAPEKHGFQHSFIRIKHSISQGYIPSRFQKKKRSVWNTGSYYCLGTWKGSHHWRSNSIGIPGRETLNFCLDHGSLVKCWLLSHQITSKLMSPLIKQMYNMCWIIHKRHFSQGKNLCAIQSDFFRPQYVKISFIELNTPVLDFFLFVFENFEH